MPSLAPVITIVLVARGAAHLLDSRTSSAAPGPRGSDGTFGPSGEQHPPSNVRSDGPARGPPEMRGARGGDDRVGIRRQRDLDRRAGLGRRTRRAPAGATSRSSRSAAPCFRMTPAGTPSSSKPSAGCAIGRPTPRSTRIGSRAGCPTRCSIGRAAPISSWSARAADDAVWSTPSRWMPLRVASRSRTPVVVVPDDWDPTTGRVVVGLDDDDSSRRGGGLRGAGGGARETPLALVHTWTMPRPQMEGSVALLASPIEARAVHRRILRDAAERAQAAHPGSRHRADPRAEQSRLRAAARRTRRISARAGHAPSGPARRARCSDRSARTCSRSAAPRSASCRASTSRPDRIRRFTRLASTGGVDAPGP